MGGEAGRTPFFEALFKNGGSLHPLILDAFC